MATLDFPRQYADGEILLAADIDAFLDSVEELVNTTGLDDDNIQPNGITASTKFVAESISSAKFEAGSVTASKLVDNILVTSDLADSAVTTGKIASATIDVAKFAADSIVTAGLASNAIVTAGIANAVITPAKFASATTSGTAVSVQTTLDTWVSACSVTISLTGNRPVLVLACPNSNGSTSNFFGASNPNGLSSSSKARCRIVEDGRVVSVLFIDYTGYRASDPQNRIFLPSASISTIDTSPVSGSRTYSLEISVPTAAIWESTFWTSFLRAYEL